MHDLVSLNYPYHLSILFTNGNRFDCDCPTEEACFDALQPHYAAQKVKSYTISKVGEKS